MKKILFVFLFALVLAFSPAAFAAAPDAEVEGLWLTSPNFPAGAEVLEFNNDTDMDMVTYIRGLDGVLTFEIRRQPIAESELRAPEDVRGLIEMRVGNDDIGEEAIEENMESIKLVENAREAGAALFTFTNPYAAAQYTTGAGEDARRNAALFIFTDVYCFEVNVSVEADFAKGYNDRLEGWFSGVRFVESQTGTEAQAIN